MSNQSALPILYSFRRCPYAMRARMGLWASGIVVELREIVLRDKPVPMLEASPKGTIPVLIQPGGKVIDESLDIMLWALGQNDPLSWLVPEKGDYDEMLELIAEIDGSFKHHLDHYKYATRYEEVDEVAHRSMAMIALASLIARLEAQEQLFGQRVSLADIALFPFVRQYANTDREWFNAHAPAPLRHWLEGHEGSELFSNIFRKWPVWQERDPITLFPG